VGQWGLGFGIEGLGSRVKNVGKWGYGQAVQGQGLGGFGFRVSDLGFRVSGLGSRVSGLGFRVGQDGEVEAALVLQVLVPLPHPLDLPPKASTLWGYNPV